MFRLPDGESNNADDDENADDSETRDRRVQFVGLPAHPPELTAENRGWTSDTYPSALSPDYQNDTAEGGGPIVSLMHLDGRKVYYISTRHSKDYFFESYTIRCPSWYEIEKARATQLHHKD